MATKRTKKRTLCEFTAWLEGIEEIQPKDWSPTKEQWDMIRLAIRNIKEVKKSENVIQQAQLSNIHPPIAQHHVAQPPAIIPPVPMPAPNIPITSQMDNIPIVPGNSNTNVKQDIDTSDGVYVSDFA